MSQPSLSSKHSLEDRIAEHAQHLGFDAIGFCQANLDPSIEEGLKAFVGAGYHGTMEWMETRIEQRAQPTVLWPEVRSVVSLGLSYAPDHDPREALSKTDQGLISVYARNRDYHDVIKGMLKHLAQFMVRMGGDGTQVKVFVDTAPVSERALAEKAHLGWQGKHTCLVSRTHGSWMLLGEIYTTLDLTPSRPQGGGCGSCSRCLTACPTNAFIGPYRMDARRCISYLTIEHKGPIPHDLRPLMGNRIYGCDDCLSACPWNRFAETGHHIKLQAREDLTAPKLAELATLDDPAFRRVFSGSPIKRIGRNRFVRNVLIAIGNSADQHLIPTAQALRADPDPDIAETATWATTRLTQPHSSDLLE
ncbi:tRNA epoxyqueuosine(34) reductase QueG [Neokomagataea anthophila]|uniref:Epoxyqueuosine reductase n=1 Tax=Neokomagataea anthophila TaxID=2826925 RepID=A0ABS5E4Q0_9PROT|nr:tRNA epoxyqueuosine(34) reductase QueG [Neokomagataea anthophila]MBR0558873.1 tRNA epoxyqueuosine(34) reductase QueG [Neokomagataea anthophila]